MKKILQIIGVIAVTAIGILSISYLQHRFDQSDLRHAVQAVRTAHPGGAGMNLEQRIGQVYGVTPEEIQWDPRLESKIKGIVRVQAHVPQHSDELVWNVDLVRFQVTPLSKKAHALSPTPAMSGDLNQGNF
jgi:hypothetical protein